MTASELLMEAMSKFGDSEPEGVVVIWISENERINVMSNVGNHGVVGMAEYAKSSCLGYLMREEQDHNDGE